MSWSFYKSDGSLLTSAVAATTATTATVATTVTVTDNESTNENNVLTFVAGADADGGDVGLESDGNLHYNPSTGALTATTFLGALTGNVTGNTSGSAGSATGNAATATALETARTIGGVSFDGTGNIDLPGVNSSGNQNTSGNAATVTTNANLTGHVTSSGNAAVLGTFSSAQLKTALSDETGSGAAVFATSPTLVTPALGTPASGDLSNCTGAGVGIGLVIALS